MKRRGFQEEEIPKVNYYGPVYDPKPDTTHRDTVIGEAELENAHTEETATPETAEEE